MKKIGFDVSDLHAGHADGTTRFTFELAKRFPGLMPEAEWTYFSSGQPAQNYQLPTTTYKLAISKWPRFWTQSRLWLDLYKHQPDVLFMPIQQLPYIRPGKMKTVAVVHDLAWHRFPDYFTYKDWALQHVFTAYVAREADHIIAVSQATAADLAQYYGRKTNVHVVHHGLDHDRFRLPASEAEREEGWQKLLAWQPTLKKPYALYVGQIQPRKNLVRLIEAFEGRDRTHAPIQQLVLAGSHGWLNAPIYERARKSPAGQQILMPGRVPEELLPALYWHAEVFVMPSLYEGFGLPLLEAMACGAPVVTGNVSSMPEVAGDAAVLVDPASVADIQRGIGEASRRRVELQTAGHARAATFTWDRTARDILSILTSL